MKLKFKLIGLLLIIGLISSCTKKMYDVNELILIHKALCNYEVVTYRAQKDSVFTFFKYDYVREVREKTRVEIEKMNVVKLTGERMKKEDYKKK